MIVKHQHEQLGINGNMKMTDGVLAYLKMKPMSKSMLIGPTRAELSLQSIVMSCGCFPVVSVICNFFSIVEKGKIIW